MRRAIYPIVLTLLAVAALASCGKQSDQTTSSSTTPPSDQTTTSATGSTMPNDAEIAAIVLVANDADIANGRQAQSKSKNSDVRAFANQMVTDHASVNDKAKALATKLNLVPQENDASRMAKSEQDSVRSQIDHKSGTDFDRAYVDNEVALHEKVLNDLDQTLIPNAQNPELKQLLTETRPVVAGHLEHARQLQSKLSGMASNP
jgi:putative membrane protein